MKYFGDNNIPAIGLGTWENVKQKLCKNAVKTAIEIGYRHIDTAQFYDNEEAVGKGIKASGVAREKLFIASKIWIKNLDHRGVIKSTKESLKRLDVDYLDCIYVHWPAGKYSPEETLPALVQLKEQGLIKNLAVSNFTEELIETALETIDSPIWANQIELHPLLQQPNMQDYLKNKEIYLVAYSPFRHGTILDNPELTALANKYDCSVPRLILAWLVQQENIITIPKASSAEHIKDNFAALEMSLAEEDCQIIETFNRGDRFVDPPFAAWK